jgi:hypothetical protein
MPRNAMHWEATMPHPMMDKVSEWASNSPIVREHDLFPFAVIEANLNGVEISVRMAVGTLIAIGRTPDIFIALG